MANTSEQHKIIAEVEIYCALNRMSIIEGIKIYNDNGLQNAAKGIENYVKSTRNRLLEAKPAHMSRYLKFTKNLNIYTNLLP